MREERVELAGGSRRIVYAAHPVDVRPGPDGVPEAVGTTEVTGVREEWLVEDRWWTGRPLRRRYFELVLIDGRDLTVFRDLEGGGWFEQRA